MKKTLKNKFHYDALKLPFRKPWTQPERREEDLNEEMFHTNEIEEYYEDTKSPKIYLQTQWHPN